MTDYKIGDRVPMPPYERVKRMRDVVPNGDDFRSRNYGAVTADDLDRDSSGKIRAPRGNMSEFGIILAHKVDCEECGASAGDRCISISKDYTGKAMKNVHGKRFRAGYAAFKPKGNR